MKLPTRPLRVLLVSALATAALASAASAQDKPAAAPAAPAEPPKPFEFLGDDAVRRPDGMIVRYYRVNYVAPDVLAKALEDYRSPGGKCTAEGATYVPSGTSKTPANASNVLKIVETEANWPVFERLLRMFDVPQPQIRVEAKVVELTWDDQLRLGVTTKVSRPVGDTFLQSVEAKFPNTLDAVNGATATFREVDKFLVFDYALQAAEQGARAEVISQPSILAGQGETATIRAGDDEPYVVQTLSGNTVSTQTQFKPVGIKLEVTPLLVGRDGVRVRIQAEASRVSDFRVTATSQNQQVVNAVISSRNADTVVTVPDGETLVIGGLEQTTNRDTKTGIPFLKDIPVFGFAFGSTTKREQRSELFFFITLKIERPEEARLFVPPSEKRRADEARARREQGE